MTTYAIWISKTKAKAQAQAEVKINSKAKAKVIQIFFSCRMYFELIIWCNKIVNNNGGDDDEENNDGEEEGSVSEHMGNYIETCKSHIYKDMPIYASFDKANRIRLKVHVNDRGIHVEYKSLKSTSKLAAAVRKAKITFSERGPTKDELKFFLLIN